MPKILQIHSAMFWLIMPHSRLELKSIQQGIFLRGIDNKTIRWREISICLCLPEHDTLVKSTTKIFSNFVAFSENPNFTMHFLKILLAKNWAPLKNPSMYAVASTEHDALAKSTTKFLFKFCGLLRKPKLYPIYDTKSWWKYKEKSWEPFLIYQLTTTANAEWMSELGWHPAHDFLHTFIMTWYHKWGVEKRLHLCPPLFRAHLWWSK